MNLHLVVSGTSGMRRLARGNRGSVISPERFLVGLKT